MGTITNDWKTDNYKFVGKAFDYAYNDRLNKLMTIFGSFHPKSVDYQMEGLGGYGEYQKYEGGNLNAAQQKRGFISIVTPEEFNATVDIHYKEAKIDKMGETRKVGKRLGHGGAMTVYLACLRMLGKAFDPNQKGGDGKPWAAADHWVASKGSVNRKSIADEDAGTFSNIIDGAFSVGNITKAQTMASRYVTPDGLPLAADMDLVLVSPELESKAKQLFGENAKLLPESQNNDANPVADMQYMVIGGGADGFAANMWAVCDRRMMKECAGIVYNTEPTVLQTSLDNPLIDRYVGYVDFGVGFGDARCIIFGRG